MSTDAVKAAARVLVDTCDDEHAAAVATVLNRLAELEARTYEPTVERDGFDTGYVLHAANIVADGGEVGHVPTVVGELLAAYGRLRIRLAELEGSDVTTEWAVRWPVDDGSYEYEEYSTREKTESIVEHYSTAVLVSREVRRGPWIAVQP